jgi:uncharacterized protein YbaP (TraB family)
MTRWYRFLVLAIAFVVSCKETPKPRPVVSATAEQSRSQSPVASIAPTVSAAPSASAVASPEVAPDPRTVRPFLWQVKKGALISWLFGTIHLGADAEKQLNPVVWKRFDESATFAMEADVGALSPFEAAKLAMLPEGETLQQKLSPDGWKKLNELIGGGLTGMSLPRYRPWFAFAAVTQTLVPTGAPMDLTLQQKATASGKKLVYLETAMEQIAMLDKAITAAVLEDMLKEFDKAERMMKGMIDSYLRGDVDALEKLAFDPEELKKRRAMFELTLTNRNKAWLPAVDKLCAKGGAFIAVGAGHLVGELGLVALLKGKGYTVERAGAQ